MSFRHPSSLLVAAVASMAVLVGLGLPTAHAAANLVQNGSFESGYPGDNVCGINWYAVGHGCNPSNTSIPGWLQTGAGVDWHNNTPDPLEPAAQDGMHTIDLIGESAAGAIEQAVGTTPGALYALSFWYAGHPFCILNNGSGTASATAAAGGSSINLTSGPTNLYTRVALLFTAAGGTTTVSFMSLTNFGCGGILIDNVSVEPLPTTKSECENDGWQSSGVFKNQGDCVSFVATQGKNEPAGG
jgi:Protein of unknown function (DUF642)